VGGEGWIGGEVGGQGGWAVGGGGAVEAQTAIFQ
jgi:hypothetical protein